MPGATMTTFVAASLVLLVTPGPSVVFVVTRALALGRTAGLVSVLGLEAGLLLHVAATVLGLSALAASSPAVLGWVRAGGVAYLVLLAVRELRPLRGRSTSRSPSEERVPEPVAAPAWRPLFRDAFVVDVLNPQALLFLLAFLPQFVDAGRGPTSNQLLVLGLVVVGLAVVCDAGWVVGVTALVAHGGPRLGAVARGRPGAVRLATGGVYLSLAALAALPALTGGA